MDKDKLIRERAHAIWEQEGRPEGRHAEHWQQAEQEVSSAEQQSDMMARSLAPSANATPPNVNPGDDAAPGTPGTAENVCPECVGSGRIAGATCENCGGSGIVIKGVAGG